MSDNAAHYAINTYSYTIDYDAVDCLNRLADRGHRAFEVMMYPGHAYPPAMDGSARKRFRSLLDQRDLRLITVNMPNVDLNIAAASAEMRVYTLDLLTQFLRFAGEMGAEGMVLGVGKPNPLLPAPRARMMGWFYEALDQLIPVSEEVGTDIWIENMPFAFLPKADEMMEAIDAYGNDKLGVVYDIANAAFIGEDLAQGIERVRPRLKLVHLSDTPKTVYKHDPVGGGIVDFGAAAAKLKQIGYSLPPMLEIISTDPDPQIADSIVKLEGMGWADVGPATP